MALSGKFLLDSLHLASSNGFIGGEVISDTTSNGLMIHTSKNTRHLKRTGTGEGAEGRRALGVGLEGGGMCLCAGRGGGGRGGGSEAELTEKTAN